MNNNKSSLSNLEPWCVVSRILRNFWMVLLAAFIGVMVAAILARTEWGVEDEAVLSAIACHTAGKPGMSRLDKILYLADMTSAERDWSGVNKLRKLERNDLDAAMLVALKQTNDFVLSQGKPLDPMSKAAYEDIQAQVEARAGTACGSSD